MVEDLHSIAFVVSLNSNHKSFISSEGYKKCTLRELRCIADHVMEITEVSGCPCELGCSHTVYEVEKLSDVE